MCDSGDGVWVNGVEDRQVESSAEWGWSHNHQCLRVAWCDRKLWLDKYEGASGHGVMVCAQVYVSERSRLWCTSFLARQNTITASENI